METSETSASVEQSAEASTTEATTVDSGGETQSVTTYANGKFESVSALEDSYSELQSTFSKKTAEYNTAMGGITGAPEAYEINEGYSVSDTMQTYARDNNFSNDALNGLAEAHASDIASQQEVYVTAQKELLGKDSEQRLTNISDWARANLGEGNMDSFNGMITSAAGVEMFEKIAKMSQGTAAAAVAQPKTMVDRDTVKAMRFAEDQYGSRRMASDPQYRAKVEAMEAEFIASGGKL